MQLYRSNHGHSNQRTEADVSSGFASVSYAARLEVVAHYLGQLAVMLALLMLVPLGGSLVFGEPSFALRYALVCSGLLAAGFAGLRLPRPRRLQVNEGLVIAGLAFLLAPLIALYPMTTGDRLPLIDVLFESVSAVTTTGLSMLTSVEDQPRSLLFARAWMQWYGGLGIAVLSVALFMGHHAAARRLAEPESPDVVATTARTHARQVLLAYVGLTLVGVGVLWVLLGDGFVALTHALSAVSTGGFSSLEGGLAALPLSAAGALTLLGVLGALPLVVLYRVGTGNLKELWEDPEPRALLIMLLAIAVLLAASLHYLNGYGWPEAAQHGLLLGASAQSTTGFASLQISDLDPTAKLLLMLAMFTGGGVGSTAGGIKLLRMLIIFHMLRFLVARSAMPEHALVFPRLAGRKIGALDFQRAALTLVLFLLATVASWLVFLVYGHDPMNALFEVVSAVGTVGLSTGITSPDLDPFLKFVLCLNMLMGRLEILALLVILYPPTWFGRRAAGL